MHGVGGAVFMKAAAAAGFPTPTRWWSSSRRMHRFPRCHSPTRKNLAQWTCRWPRHGASTPTSSLRTIRTPTAAAAILFEGGWRRLTGDEVGGLLGWWIAKRAQLAGVELSGVYAQSIVSGTLLAKIAEWAGLEYQTTLTGFKWISRVPGLVFRV